MRCFFSQLNLGVLVHVAADLKNMYHIWLFDPMLRKRESSKYYPFSANLCDWVVPWFCSIITHTGLCKILFKLHTRNLCCFLSKSCCMFGWYLFSFVFSFFFFWFVVFFCLVLFCISFVFSFVFRASFNASWLHS